METDLAAGAIRRRVDDAGLRAILHVVEPTDLTVTILREIRDEIRRTNERLDQTREELRDEIRRTNDGLDQTREELAQTRDDLGRRITQSEIRQATALVGLADAVQSVKDLLADRLDLRDRMVRCESDIAELKRRIDGVP